MIPFYPSRGKNQVVTPGAASLSVSIDPIDKSVRLVNSGSKICYVRIGAGAQTASTADTPILSGASVVLGKSDGDDTIAYISADGTTLNIQTGVGGV